MTGLKFREGLEGFLDDFNWHVLAVEVYSKMLTTIDRDHKVAFTEALIQLSEEHQEFIHLHWEPEE